MHDSPLDKCLLGILAICGFLLCGVLLISCVQLLRHGVTEYPSNCCHHKCIKGF